MKKTCVIITGPTASGKTSLSISLAQHFSAKIISADSRQCYRELEIGVAKPSPAELQAVPHFFINTHSIADDVSAAGFEAYGLTVANKIFAADDLVIMVGGTGLYIKAFCEGLDDIPPINEIIRDDIILNYRQFGLAYLQEGIEKKDPVFFKSGEMQNPQRMIRALEVVLSTGRSIVSFQAKEKKVRDFNIIKIGLDLPREVLYNRINDRVEEMMIAGLADEVKNLIPFKEKNALQTVGYREMFDFFEGKITHDVAVELIKQHTRQYAKRQLTWFKKDDEINWSAPDLSTILAIINYQLNEAVSK